MTEAAPYSVIQILPSLVSGGVERGAVDIALALAESGKGSVVISSGGPMTQAFEGTKVRHISMPVHLRTPFGIKSNISRIKHVIAQTPRCILHARSRAPAWSAFFAAKATNVPFVTTFHGAYGHRNYFKRLYNSVMVRGDKTIVASRYMMRHILETYSQADQRRMALIPRGVDMRQFVASQDDADMIVELKYRWSIQQGQYVMLLPGRVAEWKGHHILLHALAEMTQKSGWVAVILGDAEKHPEYVKRLKSLAWRLGISDRIRWVDHVSNVTDFYKASDFVLNCSVKPEAFGRTIVEAQALGKPVIATAHGGALDTVVHGETGKLVPPKNKQALSEAIQEMICMPEEVRRGMGEAGAKRVQEFFTLENMARSTLAVYDSLAAARYGGI